MAFTAPVLISLAVSTLAFLSFRDLTTLLLNLWSLHLKLVVLLPVPAPKAAPREITSL